MIFGGSNMNWNSSILWGIIGLLGGFIVSLLFFILSKRKRKLSYSITTTPIIVKKISKISDLIITYKGKNIDNLSSSYIQIKNIGNDTLEEKDFPELSKLSFITDGEFLINTVDEIEIKSSNESIKILPSLVAFNEIQLNFDYLDPKDIISCNIFHTRNIIISGNIKNGKIINNTQIEKINRLKRYVGFIIPILVAIISIISSLHTILYSIK